MKRVDFDYQMDRLKDRWSDRNYPLSVYDLFYVRLGFVPLDSFISAVDTVIASYAFAQMLPVFEALLASEINDYRVVKIAELKARTNCIHCRNEGMFSYDMGFVGVAPYSFRCQCALGYELFKRFPLYSRANVEAEMKRLGESGSYERKVSGRGVTI